MTETYIGKNKLKCYNMYLMEMKNLKKIKKNLLKIFCDLIFIIIILKNAIIHVY